MPTKPRIKIFKLMNGHAELENQINDWLESNQTFRVLNTSISIGKTINDKTERDIVILYEDLGPQTVL